MSARQQSMFDKVLFAIRLQGKPSMDNGSCRYRSADGSKCAAGHIIRDTEYTPDMEGIRIVGLYTLIPSRLKRNIPLMEDMQRAHDQSARDVELMGTDFMNEFNYKMKFIAKKRHLRYTPPLS